ncbi:hypothetical protein [Sphingobium sp. HWE2-09]|uniref:hypothetical protein n=1 Tax=Sphingobium sp. HWE2-09 TaxID=3108390 RepID=UPI002DC29BCF|nr:hypothetical protein [Sphingobium sp. HWE2-09]
MTAIIADYMTSERKVSIEIGARRRARLAVKPLLNLIEGLKINKPLVLSLARRYAPARDVDIASI